MRRRHVESAAVELGGLDVGVLALGPVAGDQRVPPRSFPVARFVEVQRQEFRRAHPVLARPPFEHPADPGMELAAPTERQAVVGDLAIEPLIEAERRVTGGAQEPRQRGPARRRPEFVRPDRLGEQVRVDDGAEHGRLTEQDPIGGVQRVDSSGDERLDRVGCRRAAGDAAADEFEQEERVGDAAAQQVVEIVVVELRIGGDGRSGQSLGLVGRHRPDVDACDVVGEVGERLVALPSQGDQQPRPSGDPAPDRCEQLLGCLVEAMGVVDPEHDRAGDRRREEIDDDLAELRGTVRRIDALDLGRHRRLGAEGDRQQGEPRLEIRRPVEYLGRHEASGGGR